MQARDAPACAAHPVLRTASRPASIARAQRGDEREQAAEAAAEKKRKLAEDEATRVAAMPDLRERSRPEYLEKRELQKIEQLTRLTDDEYIITSFKWSIQMWWVFHLAVIGCTSNSYNTGLRSQTLHC